MELGFIESLRRRWDVLGIHDTPNKPDKGKEKEKMLDVEILDEDGDLPMDTAPDEDIAPAARKEIMGGVIVKAAISSAVQGVSWLSLVSEFSPCLRFLL